MTGKYKSTVDGSIYNVFYEREGKPAKTILFMQCIESDLKKGDKFPAKDGQIENLLQHGLFKKIE